MLLRQRLDEILTENSVSTSPTPTPCWEWISELFIEATTKHPDSFRNTLSIKFYRECKSIYKRTIYEVRVDETGIIKTGYTDFAFNEVKKCIELARYNYIKVDWKSTDELDFVYEI